jgi:hypothetical protein
MNTIRNDKNEIDQLIKLFFSSFTNKGKSSNVELLKQLCIDKVIISKNTKGQTEIYDMHSFIEPRIEMLTNGTLLDFEEKELNEKTTIKENIAQRLSEYEKGGVLNGGRIAETGTKMFQFLKVNGQWKISSLIWNDN